MAQVNAVQSWVAVRGCLIVTGSGLVLGFLERHSAQNLIGVAVSWIVSAGLCWILADVLLFKLRYVPFVESRMPRNTDLAWILLRYIVLLPVALTIARLYERFIGPHLVPEIIGVSIMLTLHLSSASPRHSQSIAT